MRLKTDFTLSDFTSLGRIDFQTGSDASGTGFLPGDEVSQTSTGATGRVMLVELSNGSWAAGDAEGYMIFQTINGTTFNAAGSDIIDGGTVSADPTIVSMSGNYDGRFPDSRYFVLLEHTPDTLPSGEYGMLLDWHLSMHIANTETGPLALIGFTLDTDDVLQIPIQSSHGRRVDGRNGHFVVFGAWDDSDSKLLIYICFQGIEGEGAGASTTIEDFVLSVAAATCGDWVDIDLDTVTFHFSYDTNDTGSPADPVTAPPSLGGGGMIEQ